MMVLLALQTPTCCDDPLPPTIQKAVAVTNCHLLSLTVTFKTKAVFKTQAKAWSILRVNKSLLNEHVHAQSPDIKMSCVCLQYKTIQMHYVVLKRTYVIARNVPDDIHI